MNFEQLERYINKLYERLEYATSSKEKEYLKREIFISEKKKLEMDEKIREFMKKQYNIDLNGGL